MSLVLKEVRSKTDQSLAGEEESDFRIFLLPLAWGREDLDQCETEENFELRLPGNNHIRLSGVTSSSCVLEQSCPLEWPRVACVRGVRPL